MFDELDEENAKKIKYLIAMGVAFVIFLFLTLNTMNFMSPNKKKKDSSATTAKKRF